MRYINEVIFVTSYQHIIYSEVAEKAKEGYESDVSDLEENDNIIDEMMQSDDNFSYSGNR